MRVIQGILLLIFLAAVLIFAVQNNEGIGVRFLNWTIDAPKSLLILASYLLGMLSGWTVIAFVTRSLHRVSERND